MKTFSTIAFSIVLAVLVAIFSRTEPQSEQVRNAPQPRGSFRQTIERFQFEQQDELTSVREELNEAKSEKIVYASAGFDDMESCRCEENEALIKSLEARIEDLEAKHLTLMAASKALGSSSGGGSSGGVSYSYSQPFSQPSQPTVSYPVRQYAVQTPPIVAVQSGSCYIDANGNQVCTPNNSSVRSTFNYRTSNRSGFLSRWRR